MTKDIQPVLQSNEGKITTYTGIKLDFLNPTPEMISLEDVAHALSLINRFGGHTELPYSVAQHTLLVYHLAPPELKKAALLHDFAEAYIGDVIQPLKVLLGKQYKELEDRFDRLVFEKYGVPYNYLQHVKPYDLEAVVLEYEYFYIDNKEPLEMVMESRYPNTPVIWHHKIAENRLLRLLKHLFRD